jgi:hypothetical protein
VDWACGNRSAQTLKKILDRLRALDVKIFFADNWAVYVELILPVLLVQTKVETHGVERNYFCQCIGVGGFVGRFVWFFGVCLWLICRFFCLLVFMLWCA